MFCKIKNNTQKNTIFIYNIYVNIKNMRINMVIKEYTNKLLKF